jgi:hypothetical protein
MVLMDIQDFKNKNGFMDFNVLNLPKEKKPKPIGDNTWVNLNLLPKNLRQNFWHPDYRKMFAKDLISITEKYHLEHPF